MRKQMNYSHKKVLITLILLFSITFIALSTITTVSASSSVIYVNGSSGNDAWDGQYTVWRVGTLSGPKKSIKNATGTVTEGGTVHIANGQYTGENNTDITVNKNMALIGQSKTSTIINGTNTAQIFRIQKGKTVTIYNLTFANGNSTLGGAIYNNGTLNVINCTFKGNAAPYIGPDDIMASGGTIYNNNASILTVTGSTFVNNHAEDGGAIYNCGGGTITITGSTFTGNTADYGGAITNYGILNVTSSNFANSSGTFFGGTIANYYGKLTVTSSNFTNGTSNYGGGIYNSAVLTVTGSSFTNNIVTPGGGDGGAIYSYGNLVVNNSTFTGNKGTFGGAIANDGGSSAVINSSIFKDNIVSYGGPEEVMCEGGAIYNREGGILTVTGSTFENNHSDSGGAIYNNVDSNMTIIGNTFTSNAASYGGAILNDGNMTVTSSKFINSNGTFFGGAINNQGNLTVNSSTFTNGTSNFGGAISNIAVLIVNGSTFTNNTIDFGGGYGGGAIYNTDWGTSTVNNSTFTGNKGIVGGAIYNENGNLTIHFSRIVGNNQKDIYSDSGSVNAEYNWWGSNASPSGRIYGLNVSKWMVLNVTANPTLIKNGGTSTIKTDLLHDSSGVYHNPIFGHVPDGIPVKFTTTLGTMGTSSGFVINGVVQAVLTGGNISGIANVFTVVDNQTIKKLVNIDSKAPVITAVDPLYNDVHVPANKIIKITFSEAIKAGNNFIELKNSNGTVIPIINSINGTVLTITHNNNLTAGNYTLIIHSGSVTDLAGNPLTIYTSIFTVDIKSPTVNSIDPINNALNVSISKSITVTFSEPVKAGNNWIELKTSDGAAVSFTTVISNNVLTVTPAALLNKGVKYSLILHTGSIVDLAGNPLAALSSRFTTATT